MEDKKVIKKEPPRLAEVVQVIHVLATKGDGADENPVRLVRQFWSFDGTLLAESDADSSEPLRFSGG